MERFKAPAGVVLMLTRTRNGKNQILLHRRKNTGFADGLLDFSCSGHVENNEPMSDTVRRECLEELGISIKTEDIKFVCFVHKKDKDKIYYYGYFVCNKFDGEPKIMEKDKCAELIWVDIDYLPPDVIPDRIAVLQAFKTGIHYLEFGWDN